MSAIISITTIPDRIEHIERCIKSLVQQELPVYLWAVEKIARSDTTLKRIPPFLGKLGVHVEIVEDCGPITKLLPALSAGFDVILTADDDCTYDTRWAAGLLAWSKKFPAAAIGLRGRILTGKVYKNSHLVLKSRITKPVLVHVITAVYGALYKREFFDDGIFEEYKLWPMNDDLVISAHLKRRKVPRYVVPVGTKIVDCKTRSIAPLFGFNTQGVRHNDKGLKVLDLIPKKPAK
jgi:hypothetical protein